MQIPMPQNFSTSLTEVASSSHLNSFMNCVYIVGPYFKKFAKTTVCNRNFCLQKIIERPSVVLLTAQRTMTTSCIWCSEENFCSMGHNLQLHITRRFFNCVAKNLVKFITNIANKREPPAKKRKIAKLQSTQRL